jgi:hypothetical protein
MFFIDYVLGNFNRPIKIAEFEVKLVEKLPKDLKSSLHSKNKIVINTKTVFYANPKNLMITIISAET